MEYKARFSGGALQRMERARLDVGQGDLCPDNLRLPSPALARTVDLDGPILDVLVRLHSDDAWIKNNSSELDLRPSGCAKDMVVLASIQSRNRPA